MKQIIADIRESAKQIKQVRSLTGGAMFIALNLILNFWRIVISSFLEISFAFLALAAAGALYGPVMAGIIGAIADILGFIIRPSGTGFFLGFTLNDFVAGFIFGMFFYKKKASLKRTICAVAVYTVAIEIILTPIWLNIMYGSVLMSSARIIKAAVSFPVNTVLLYTVLKTVEKIGRHGRVV